jgi:hypothetical protein
LKKKNCRKNQGEALFGTQKTIIPSQNRSGFQIFEFFRSLNAIFAIGIKVVFTGHLKNLGKGENLSQSVMKKVFEKKKLR